MKWVYIIFLVYTHFYLHIKKNICIFALYLTIKIILLWVTVQILEEVSN
jgi:DMSO/TMAO reductase YedYZ heme-binding membrane subunit